MFPALIDIFVYVALGIAILLSIFVRDFENVRKSPLKFLIECIVVFLLPAIPLIMFKYTQQVDWNVVYRHTQSIGLKLVALHIFFTFAGFYNIWFEKEYPHPGTERNM